MAQLRIIVELPAKNSKNPITGPRAEILRYALVATEWLGNHWSVPARLEYVPDGQEIGQTIATVIPDGVEV